MANKKVYREDRDKSPEFNNIDLMEPVDISLLGTDDDPCFGKHYNLATDECQRCGDHEFCAIKMGQTLHKTRAKIESKNDFLDVQEEVEETKPLLSRVRLKKLVRSKKDKGYSSIKTFKILSKKYNVDKNQVKEIYNDL